MNNLGKEGILTGAVRMNARRHHVSVEEARECVQTERVGPGDDVNPITYELPWMFKHKRRQRTRGQVPTWDLLRPLVGF